MDVHDHIWTFSLVPGHFWKRGLAAVQNLHGTSVEVTDYDLVYDTRVEIFDAKTGALVVTSVVPQAVTGVLSDGRVVTLETTSEGNAFANVWRARVSR